MSESSYIRDAHDMNIVASLTNKIQFEKHPGVKKIFSYIDALAQKGVFHIDICTNDYIAVEKNDDNLYIVAKFFQQRFRALNYIVELDDGPHAKKITLGWGRL